MKCISVETMRMSDAYTIAHFVPSLQLMHRAAMGVYLAAKWTGKIAIVVGSGNNGGDGYALACILQDKGYECGVYYLGQKRSQDSEFFAAAAAAQGIPIIPFDPKALSEYDTLVDCLLGTGYAGPLRPQYREAIEAINASDAYVISVDINSGMNGDTGEAEIAVRSDLTVTIGFVKNGLVAPQAEKYIARLVCADIGIVLTGQDVTSITPPAWVDPNIIHVGECKLPGA